MQSFPAVAADPGVIRQVLADSPELMLVSFRFLHAGAEGRLHSHPHVQATYCAAGRFRFTLGDAQFEVGPGQSFVIASNVQHGCLCLEPGELIDSFTPRRADFL
jgi:quercetin dioxygenase-like cupin family protein